MTEQVRAELNERFRVMKQERDDLGALLKIKKQCGPEVSRYIARLLRWKQEATDRVDHFPVAGDDLISQAQDVKSTRKILARCVRELEDVEVLYNAYGEHMATIQQELKKTKKPLQSRSSAVLPLQ